MLTDEQIAHINIVNWFREIYPELSDDFHHFANERKCSAQQGRLLKRMGVMKGVSDFFLAFPIDGYCGLWIELKVNKGTITKEQERFLTRKMKNGYGCAAVWGSEAAKEVIKSYLRNYRTNRVNSELKNMFNNKPIC